MSTATENADYLIRQARAAGITDRRELAIFMGQMQVECGGFRSMHEGLSYRAERLLAVFGPYTDRRGVWYDGRNGLTNIEEARAIVARGREGIAEAVYGGAWGARSLGNTEPGDGWKYHGRGYVQLTGRDNYARIGRALGIDLVNNPDLAADREIAAQIAIHYWQDRVRANGNQLNVQEATRDINGGQNHLAERRTAASEWERKFEQGYLERLRPQLGSSNTSPPQTRSPSPTPAGADGQLRPCESGPEVTALQRRLNALGYRDDEGRRLAEDGDFGANTREAVVAFQNANGLQELGVVGPRTMAALENSQPARESAPSPAPPQPAAARGDGRVIYEEAYRHFLAGGNQFEYGRGDMRLGNREGNLRTDSSRTEQDLDHDGLKGVDCSSFVWRGLKNAGYDVPARPFATHALFNGRNVTAYSREHFNVIPAADAARDSGNLQPGDILLFKDKRSGGQHVGIFKGYDSQGDIQFIGSQVSTGPAQAEAGQGSYWNGGRFEIVGALRAKPEFQVRAPLHANEAPTPERTQNQPTAPQATSERPAAPSASRPTADADGQLKIGEKGPAVATLQQRLADLGYRGADGKPLGIDGDFGINTRHALQQFQREHGLEGKGVAGPRTEIALDRAERALMSHPSHPHHALYTQVLERVHAEERTRGIASGHHSQRIAAALAVECLREGITRVDRVELNRDTTLVRGVQVSAVRDEPGLNRATDATSTRQASQQPMAESSEQIHQVAVNQQASLRDEQQRQARPSSALAN